MIGTFKNGKAHGNTLNIVDNGRKAQCYYVHGKLEGIVKVLEPNGQETLE